MRQWSPRGLLLTCLAGLSLCALLSVYKGQDTNWDLLNYHHYVAYALLHGRLSVDLAAAGMQSYINPSLDVPIYWLTEHLRGWQVGALIGAWHGLVFVLTLLIAREVWPTEQAGGGALLIVCAGVLAPVFWGGLGNAMGDNAAAVLALGATWAAIKGLKQLDGRTASGWVWFGATGFLLGACTALKLTNATVAVALGLAMLFSVRKPVLCLRLVACMLPCGLLGFALGGGWWLHQIWLQFGNPFFPQFGSIFPSKLASSVSLADKRFVAESLGGLILRPVLMLFNSGITSEFFVLPILWPIWFASGFLLLTRLMWRRVANGLTMGQSWRPEQQLVVVFVLLAVLFWAALFGIYRYTAAMEPLLPLCMVLLLSRAGCLTATIGAWLNRILVLSMLCTLLGGAVNWGHTGWATQTYRAASPMSVRGDKPLVIVVGSGNSWLIPFLSPKASYTNVGGNFQFGQRFDAEVQRRALAADRVYALVGMSQNWRFDVVDKANEYLGVLGVLDRGRSCQWLSDAVQRTKPHAGFSRCEGPACEHRCHLTRLEADRAEVDRRDQASLGEAAVVLHPLGLHVNDARCTIEAAYLGQKRYPFRLCELELAEPQFPKP
jgi:hypothetical protein